MNKNTKDILNAYETIAEKYNEILWNDMPYNTYIDRFMSLLNGKKIIDMGCAMGSFTKYVKDHGFDIEGIDISPKMIELAKIRDKSIKYQVMDMLNLHLKDVYDGIMAINSTIHIEKRDMEHLFKSFYNIMKDEGVFFIILQEGEGEKYVDEPFNPNVKELVSFYQTDEIESLFNKIGFKIIGKDKIFDDSEFELGNDQLVYYLKK